MSQAVLREVPVIETGGMILRAHRAEDFDDYARMWAEPAVTRFIGGRGRSREESWQRFLRHPGMWSILGYGYWAIEDRATGAFVGEAGFHDMKRDMTPSIEGLPEAGWVLGPQWQGRGLAGEIVAAMLEWADRRLADPRTVCIIDADNVASLRVAERCGFRAIGTAIYGDKQPVLLERLRRTPAA